MGYTKEKIRLSYEKLSPEIKNFIMSNDVLETIETHLKNAGLNENEAEQADSEIFYTLLGLQGPDVAIKNISTICRKEPGSFQSLKENLMADIFSKVSSELFYEWKNSDSENDYQGVTKNSIGQSFERIILNQARAMQPARLASESVAGGPAREAGSGSQQPASSSRVPDNLPTEDLKPKPAIPNYSGQDPYREPVE